MSHNDVVKLIDGGLGHLSKLKAQKFEIDKAIRKTKIDLAQICIDNELMDCLSVNIPRLRKIVYVNNNSK